MNLSTLGRTGVRRPRARAARLLGAAALALLAAACGSDSSQYEPFVPTRLLAFGDELSVLTPDGRKYAVNGLNAAGAIDCQLEPLWIQSVASSYNFVFPECNPAGVAAPQARTRAAVGAKVADVAAQVEAQAASADGFGDRDLTLVLAGINDVLALYAQRGQTDESQLLEQARARGEQLANVVNRLVELKAKVVVSMLPDMGLSPFARAQEAASPGSAGLLTRLTVAFNERLGVKVLLDGRYVGLMQTDLRSQLIDRFPGSYPPLTNMSAAACTVALPDCTTATLVSGASAAAYFWADGTRLASGGQQQLATLALERAQRSPF